MGFKWIEVQTGTQFEDIFGRTEDRDRGEECRVGNHTGNDNPH